MTASLKGTGVALATPLNKDFSVDYPSLARLLDHIVAGEADYLVVQGTTGESPVFSWTEKLKLLHFVIDHLKGTKPIVFGLGGNNTFDLIEKSKDLRSFPLAAILSVSPYYSKPSQGGIIRHYHLLADAFPHPIILYNVPARTASNVEAETTLQLATHPNIIGIKEASGNLTQCRQIAENRPPDFLLLSGDDALALDIIKMGGEGVISVIGNILTTPYTRMVRTALSGDFAQAEQWNQSLNEAYHLLAAEGNPTSLKAGLEAMNICKRTVKPPLLDASDALVQKWQKYLSTHPIR